MRPLPLVERDPAPGVEAIRTLYLEITNRCNSLCATCPLTYGPAEPERDLSAAEMRAVVRQAPGVQRVVLHGVGEPLLNRELVPMVRWLAGRGIAVDFHTNAIALTRQRGDALGASGLTGISFSIDGATRETYRAIRGVDAFERVIANVGAFVRRLPAQGGPRLGITFTCLRANLEELVDVVRLAARLGVPELQVQRLVWREQGLAREEQSLYRALGEREAALVEEAETEAARLGVTLGASAGVGPLASLRGEHPPRGEGCARPWTLAYVTCHGSVLSCCFAPFTGLPHADLVLGDVRTTPLAEIWAGAPYRALRDGLAGRAAEPPVCSGCGERWPY